MDQLHAYIEYTFNAFYNLLMTDTLDKLIEAAIAAGETEESLAAAIGVSQATVSRLASGAVSASSKSGRALLRYLESLRSASAGAEIAIAVERLVHKHPAKRRAIIGFVRSLDKLLD